MTITTKFNINDEVWFIYQSVQKVGCGKVGDVTIKVQGTQILEPDNKKGLAPTGNYKEKSKEIIYQIYNESRGEILKKESELFLTKEALIDSL